MVEIPGEVISLRADAAWIHLGAALRAVLQARDASAAKARKAWTRAAHQLRKAQHELAEAELLALQRAREAR